jgi:hypothetical protein
MQKMDDKEKCPVCNGTKYVANPSYTGGVGCEPYWLPCPACDSTGIKKKEPEDKKS